MTGQKLPLAAAALLPHGEPARLVRTIVEVGEGGLDCIAVIPAESPFVERRAGGGLGAPAFLGLEAAAQAAAALEALSRQREEGGAGPRRGYLVGVSAAVFHTADLPVGVPLTVRIQAAGSAPPLAVYEVWVGVGATVRVTGTLSTYLQA